MSASLPGGRNNNKRVVIVGGGLAGIAAAAALHGAGCTVTLIEARHALGGRASSFEDPQTDGQLLDNCQHVLLGCCTNLIDLYRRLGVADKIRYERTIYFRDGNGRRFALWGVNGLPAPLHLGPAMALFGLLTIGERVAVQRAMIAMQRMGRSGREKLETVAFGDWLDGVGTPASVITKFYDPVLISALNEETRLSSAKYAIEVFQDALLAHRAGYVVGLPTGPLNELYQNKPCADVRISTRASEILFEENRATGVLLQSGEKIMADAVLLATNHHAVQRWIPAPLMAADTRFAGLEKIESVPILGAHLWFDRPVMSDSHAALVEGPLQWLFRKDAAGKVLHGVISAARAWVSIPKEHALQQFAAQVKKLFPQSNATLHRGLIVIEKRATFSPKPGVDALRPCQGPPTGGIAGLYLAGDYTKTDWPATMEGAVRSGYRAAEAITGDRFVVPDLPVEWPGRIMGLNR